MAFTPADEAFMNRALALAERGLYTTDPNPRVGCVLVRDGEVIGEGYHVRAGEGHAEVNAVAAAGGKAQGATAYVTLEPCSHYGRTPPCAELLIKQGVSRVVCGMVDPNPQVGGRGIKMLQQAGIQAEAGLFAERAAALNPGFIKRMEQQLPLVRLKLAMSVDGRTAMASGESQWITGAEARSDVQRLRARSSAVVTGINSILVDDSSLTVRANELNLPEAGEIAKRQPRRVVLDSQLRLPLEAKILRQPGTTSIHTLNSSSVRRMALEQTGAEVVAYPTSGSRLDLRAVLKYLALEDQCNEVLVECGATLAGSFIAAGLVDELVTYVAPKLLGSDARPLLRLPLSRMAEQISLQLEDVSRLGDDLRLTWHPLANQEQIN